MSNEKLILVKKLREDTGAGIDMCNNAIKEANGDYDAALEILKLKGLEKAAKKVNNITSNGSIVVKQNDSKAVLLNFRAETDFAVNSEGFCNFISNEAENFLNSDMNNIQDLENNGQSFNDRLANYASILGENITLNNCKTFYNSDEISNIFYFHQRIKNYKDIAAFVVVLQVSSDSSKDLSLNIAKHIAASDSLVVSKNDITDKLKQENSCIEDFVLLDQQYFDNPDLTVKEFAEQNNIKIISFKTFSA